ncbi:MAG: cupin domain-containing protein [Tistlia sp.]|uniref:cupin domain-containing protein n=1 Tax=Tistlia sp. TaxID=3057121 RepID=UPI0034A2A0F0
MDGDRPFDLGQQLRALREQQNLSQRALARRAGVSHGVVSLIEQNKTSPSVGLLKKILDGVPISLARFFEGPAGGREPVYFAAGELAEIAGGRISYRQVGRDLSGKSLQILHERYAPGADTGEAMLSHAAEEGGVVVRGCLEVTVGGLRRVLAAGDAYYFDSRQPHRFRNVGTEEAEVVSACTPPSF